MSLRAFQASWALGVVVSFLLRFAWFVGDGEGLLFDFAQEEDFWFRHFGRLYLEGILEENECNWRIQGNATMKWKWVRVNAKGVGVTR